ncbi:MAG: rod shape-determining protein RodA [Planctomycetes bacterium]|nr:rod shape-determining protein RodA [Planctomycetota bacterium]
MKRPIYDLTWPGIAIFAASMCLCVVGLLCIIAVEGSAGAAALKQVVFVIASLAAGAAVLAVGYQRLGRFAYALFGFGLFLLALMVLARVFHGLPMIRPINGTYRWISLPGFSVQPSEIMKVAFIIGLAWYLRHKEDVRRFKTLIGPFVLTVVPVMLVLLQPDLGTALLLMPVLFVMLFAAGARLRHFAVVALLAVCCLPLFWSRMQDYQKERIAGLVLQYDSVRQRVKNSPDSWKWLCPEGKSSARRWERGAGYQLTGSLGALGNGGWAGQGWGNGAYVRHAVLLPARENDFIFAIIGEQWGFVGCLCLLGCYVVIVVAGLEIAARTDDPFGRLLAVGVVALLGTQTLINIGMTIGLTPITGMNLPFVSSGGSSLIANFALIALLINVSQDRPFLLARKPFENPEPDYAGIR